MNPLRFVSEASFWEPENHGLSEPFYHAPFIFWLFDILKPALIVDEAPVSSCSYTLREAARRHNLKTTFLALGNDDQPSAQQIDIVHLRCESQEEYPLSQRVLDKLSDKAVILISGSLLAEEIRRDSLKDFASFQFDGGRGFMIFGRSEKLPETLRELLSFENGSPSAAKVRNIYQRLSNLMPSQQLVAGQARINNVHEECFRQIRAKEDEYTQLLGEYESLVTILERVTADLFNQDREIDHLKKNVEWLDTRYKGLEITSNNASKSIHELTFKVERLKAIVNSATAWQAQNWRKRLFNRWENPEISAI